MQMARWASSVDAASKVNFLMVCLELGQQGLHTAQAFGQQFQLPASVCNGYIEQKCELPSFGQLGCQGFVVLGPYGEYAMQRTVPCYLEAEEGGFQAVERLLSSLWSIRLEPVLSKPAPTASHLIESVGVAEMDAEHEGIHRAMEQLEKKRTRDAMEALMSLWIQHSEHEEQLFHDFDFGRHRTAGKHGAATGPHCEHHRLIASKMRASLEGQASPSNHVDSIIVEIKRHTQLYDAAYAGKLTVGCHATS